MDIFKQLLWYTYKDNSFKWFQLTLEQVNEIIDLNKNNEDAAPLEDYESDVVVETKVDFENVVGQDSLTRFDAPKQKKGRRKNNRNKKRPAAKTQNTNQPNKPKQKRNPNQNKKATTPNVAENKQTKKPFRKNNNRNKNQNRNKPNENKQE